MKHMMLVNAVHKEQMRMATVDENGKLIDGDQIMAACAKFMRDNGTLKQNTLRVVHNLS